MSTYFYGDTVSYWCAYGEYSTSTSNTAVTITLAGGWRTLAWRFDIDYVDCTTYIGSQSSSTSNNSVNETSSTTENVEMVEDWSYSVTRTTSAQTVTLKVVTYNHSGYKDGTSTATTTVTVPALASYTITYNANGGSGAPSSQTKYYGVSLTLSTTKPTRSGYTFLGWSTSSSATSATYAAGATYTANSAATLYAVWELDEPVAPTISSFTAYRSNSSGTKTATGTYLRISCKWSVDTAYNSANVGKSLVVKYTPSGGTATSKTVFSSGTSTGTTTTSTISASLDSSTTYTVVATLTDANGLTASKTAKLAAGGAIIDVSSDGTQVGLLTTADNAGLTIGGNVYMGASSPMVYGPSGENLIDLLNSSGNTAIGYYHYKAGSGYLNLYGDDVRIIANGHVYLRANDSYAGDMTLAWCDGDEMSLAGYTGAGYVSDSGDDLKFSLFTNRLVASGAATCDSMTFQIIHGGARYTITSTDVTVTVKSGGLLCFTAEGCGLSFTGYAVGIYITDCTVTFS